MVQEGNLLVLGEIQVGNPSRFEFGAELEHAVVEAAIYCGIEAFAFVLAAETANFHTGGEGSAARRPAAGLAGYEVGAGKLRAAEQVVLVVV